ncbi:Dynein assembly factor 1, axonemal [Gossypium australe]|uniref:Dynein assembly factor 1, axonemal n=1 Tax=Gossypium australe TaxID=47621 RepID=A0A5B6UAR4_9ROSI|nr:Dynein assembly factor 1, axonemal [Gossypium australe]
MSSLKDRFKSSFWQEAGSSTLADNLVTPSRAGEGVGPFISGGHSPSDSTRSLGAGEQRNSRTLQIKLQQQPVKPLESDELKSATFSVPAPVGFKEDCNVKVIRHGSPVRCEAVEKAYEGEDEHEENASIKREFSDFDLQAHVVNSSEEFDFGTKRVASSDSFETEAKEEVEKAVDKFQSGHVSDPGMRRAEFWASPMLKRSCSDLERRNVLREVADHFPPSQSFEDLQDLSAGLNLGSPASMMTRCSADRVMLKKHSSSQVLPSRSRKLWWKFFLWSHRNSHNWMTKPQPAPITATLNQQGGYSSDTIDLHQAMEPSKMESPGSFTGESLNKGFTGNCDDNRSWKGFHNGVSGLWPQNQWVAFPAPSSSFSRVDEWVRDLETGIVQLADNVNDEECITFPPSPDTGKSPARNTAYFTRRSDINLSEEILHANSVIQTLNSSSTVAHISGIGLKAIPIISGFTSLRSVNLSNNFITHITPGSLPKGVHILNLSRNKISTIEGLRELTRLRVVDLSYNRIARIGHGLSNCILIKELYLAGNKISDVEGLHRFLKLTVLDLSFNKITTTKALGQLVANYNSLQALNLLGNPVQSNISDDQLRKAVCSLLPKLTYLNKQPIKPQRAREVLTDSVAKAALGSGSWSSRRKASKRTSQGASTSASVHRGSVGVGHKNKNKSKSRSRYHSSAKSPALASSSR